VATFNMDNQATMPAASVEPSRGEDAVNLWCSSAVVALRI
jgi:hypothetical protein